VDRDTFCDAFNPKSEITSIKKSSEYYRTENLSFPSVSRHRYS
jgi:hypothetical protein